MSNPQLRFHRAIEDNNLRFLNSISSQDCKRRNEHGLYPIHFAAVNGKFEALRLIIQKCGKKEARRPDKYGNSPLHCAVISGQLTSVSYLSQQAPETIWSLNDDMHLPQRLAEICDQAEIAAFLKELSSKEKSNKPSYVEKLSQYEIKKVKKRIGISSHRSHTKTARYLEEPKNPLLRVYHKSSTGKTGIYEELPHSSSSTPTFKFTPMKESPPSSEYDRPHSRDNSPFNSVPTSRNETHSLPNQIQNSWVSDQGAVARKVNKKRAENMNTSLSSLAQSLGNDGSGSIRSTFTLRPGINIAYASPSSLNGLLDTTGTKSQSDRHSMSNLSDSWGDNDSVHSNLSKAYSEPEIQRFSFSEGPSQTSAKGILHRPGLGTFTFFSKPNYNAITQNDSQSVVSSSSALSRPEDNHQLKSTAFIEREPQLNGRLSSGKGSLVRLTKERLSNVSYGKSTASHPLVGDDSESIFTFLNAIDLTEFCSLMKKEKIDLNALMRFNETDLKRLNLPVAARQKISQAIQDRKYALRNPGPLADTLL